MIVTSVSKSEFAKKVLPVENVDLVASGFITKEDFLDIRQEFGIVNISEEVSRNLAGELRAAFSNPIYLIRNAPRIFTEKYKGIKKSYLDSKKSLKDRYPLTDYFYKASLIKALKPKRILELGTWYGWGIGMVKAACPDSECITINIDGGEDTNNFIKKSEVGKFYKSKGLEIKQIFADSLEFDFTSVAPVDICYIDGNHHYDYVYSDLCKCSSIATKAVLLDDYIPDANSPRGDIMMYGWNNKEVVQAVNDFLAKNATIFKEAYWIEDTPVCILLK